MPQNPLGIFEKHRSPGPTTHQSVRITQELASSIPGDSNLQTGLRTKQLLKTNYDSSPGTLGEYAPVLVPLLYPEASVGLSPELLLTLSGVKSGMTGQNPRIPSGSGWFLPRSPRRAPLATMGFLTLWRRCGNAPNFWTCLQSKRTSENQVRGNTRLLIF